MAESKSTNNPKKLSADEIRNSPAVKEITRNGKEVASEPFGDSELIFFLVKKDGAQSIFAAYSVDGQVDSESEALKTDPNYRPNDMEPHSMDKLNSANVRYTVQWMSEHVKNEQALRRGDDTGSKVKFSI